jgi:hypothetical protein
VAQLQLLCAAHSRFRSHIGAFPPADVKGGVCTVRYFTPSDAFLFKAHFADDRTELIDLATQDRVLLGRR